MIGDNFGRIQALERQKHFNLAEQELALYQASISHYQADRTFDYYLSPGEPVDDGKFEFRNVTIESFVSATVLRPVTSIFEKTSKLLMSRYLMSKTKDYCQLQDHLKMVFSVYFLHGVSMPQFLLTIYDNIDSGQLLDNKLYLINASFQDALSDLLTRSLPNIDQQVLEWMRFSVEKGQRGLGGFRLSYDC